MDDEFLGVQIQERIIEKGNKKLGLKVRKRWWLGNSTLLYKKFLFTFYIVCV